MSSSGGREDGLQLFGGGPALERHREAHVVVDAFPLAERDLGSVERLAARAIPELLGIDSVTPLDFAVLIRAGLDVPMADAPALDGQEEGKGKLCPTVGLQPADGEGERPRDLAEEVEAREYMQPLVQSKESEPRTVIDGGVLVGFGAPNLDDLDVEPGRIPQGWPSRRA